MATVSIYTDFDGTVTKKSGSRTVFTPFYQSLLIGYKEGFSQSEYKTIPMIEPGEVQSAFEAKFGRYDKHFNKSQAHVDLLMSSDAVTFFHETLKDDEVTINIVTRNRSDYIKALFKYQGFSDVEINKLTILESGYKFDDVNGHLKYLKDKATKLYILDDTLSDFNDMVRAAQVNGYKEDQIVKYNKMPGQFEWSKYQQDIRELINPYRTLKVMGLLSAIGFTIGFTLGVALVATGVFAPFGVGVLGALALGASCAGGVSVLFGTIGFGAAKATEFKPLSLHREGVEVNRDSHKTMQELGSKTTVNKSHVPVEHFSAPLTEVTVTTVKTEDLKSDQEEPLNNKKI